MYYKMMYESPLGPMILAASDTALVGGWFEGQKYCYGALQGEVLREEDTPILRKAAHWLDDYFAGADAGYYDAAPGAAGQCVPPPRLVSALPDSLWSDDDLW